MSDTFVCADIRKLGFPGFDIEVKAADSDAYDLKSLAAAALRQIGEKNCPAALRAEGVAEIVKLGLAYRAKHIEMVVGLIGRMAAGQGRRLANVSLSWRLLA